ncbi:polysaccharide deacetylase family protein [Streptomyces sp. NPDC079020]|uniref:polysaccharide deacetylase family protein n=1 Tax=Streptomyces sp. NPDC079020 TaxID=3365722 RepID=UPI0037D3F8FA
MNGREPEMCRRGALRAGAGALTAGALLAGCAEGRGTTPAAADDPHAASAAGSHAASPSASPARNARDPAPAHAPAPAPRRFPGQPVQVENGPRSRPRVALTFHGQGDPAVAGAVLAEAERAGARLTVLAVGSWLDEHPGMARRILDGGHDLGNHTQRHLDINTMSENEAYAEITACAQRLRRLTGSIGTWFRPSRARYATPLVQRLARRAGYPHVLSYDVDSLDFTSPGVAAVTRKVAGEIRNGSVVSLHFGYADTAAALPLLLAEINRRRLRAVTTTELLT